MEVSGQRHAPAALPPGKTQYPLYRRLGGPQGLSGRMRKFSTTRGFDLRTLQPVASRYTDELYRPMECIQVMNEVSVSTSERTNGEHHFEDRGTNQGAEMFALHIVNNYSAGCRQPDRAGHIQ